MSNPPPLTIENAHGQRRYAPRCRGLPAELQAQIITEVINQAFSVMVMDIFGDFYDTVNEPQAREDRYMPSSWPHDQARKAVHLTRDGSRTSNKKARRVFSTTMQRLADVSDFWREATQKEVAQCLERARAARNATQEEMGAARAKFRSAYREHPERAQTHLYQVGLTHQREKEEWKSMIDILKGLSSSLGAKGGRQPRVAKGASMTAAR